MILIIIKFCELLLRISPRITNSLRSYIKHSKECFLLFPNTSKLVKKTRLRLVFPTYFSVFGNRKTLFLVFDLLLRSLQVLRGLRTFYLTIAKTFLICVVYIINKIIMTAWSWKSFCVFKIKYLP